MPIFARYLLGSYFRVLFLSLFSFISILLISRLKEIAEFAALGAKISYLALFTLYQIPYILPLALPVSCLISSIILFQRLSQTREFTAFRALGISLKKLVLPILIASGFLSLFGFYLTSELASTSHLASRKMVYDLSSVNPLLLLQNAKIAKLQGAYVQMSPVHQAKEAKDLLIALNHERLHLCIAKKLKMKGPNLLGENVSLISSAPGDKTDHLVIENQKSLLSSAKEFSKMLRNQGFKLGNDYLKFRLLKVRFRTLKEEIAGETHPHKKIKLMRMREKCRSEIVRRISLALAPLTFSLLGVSCGMEISRRERKRGLFYVLFLGSFALISFFIGKEFDHLFYLASLFFVLPHIAIAASSIFLLSNINRGIE